MSCVKESGDPAEALMVCSSGKAAGHVVPDTWPIQSDGRARENSNTSLAGHRYSTIKHKRLKKKRKKKKRRKKK